jgi:hypothetical protein
MGSEKVSDMFIFTQLVRGLHLSFGLFFNLSHMPSAKSMRKCTIND